MKETKQRLQIIAREMSRIKFPASGFDYSWSAPLWVRRLALPLEI